MRNYSEAEVGRLKMLSRPVDCHFELPGAGIPPIDSRNSVLGLLHQRSSHLKEEVDRHGL
jgi:hypothetical protein